MKNLSYILTLLTSITISTTQAAEKNTLTSYTPKFTLSGQPGLTRLLAMPASPLVRTQLLAICAAPTNVHDAQSVIEALNNSIHAATPQKFPVYAQTQDADYDTIPEFEEFKEIGNILRNTLALLEHPLSDKSALEKLQDSWGVLGSFQKLSSETFKRNLAENFKRVQTVTTKHYDKAYTCLGLDSLDGVTPQIIHEKATELLQTLELLKQGTATKRDQELILRTIDKACTAGFLNPDSFTSLKDLQDPAQFLAATESSFFFVLRQTRILLREPISLALFKSYCQGDAVFTEKTKQYQAALDNYNLNQDLITETLQALLFKKSGETPDTTTLTILRACSS